MSREVGQAHPPTGSHVRACLVSQLPKVVLRLRPLELRARPPPAAFQAYPLPEITLQLCPPPGQGDAPTTKETDGGTRREQRRGRPL